MTVQRLVSVYLFLTVLAACGGTAPTTSATSGGAAGQLAIGQAIVSWREFNVIGQAPPGQTNVMFQFRGVNEVVDDLTNPADGCFPAMRNYEACRRANRELVLTRSEAIALASQAMAADPRCRWDGFDAGYDARVRATGLARGDDNRVLFAAVSC